MFYEKKSGELKYGDRNSKKEGGGVDPKISVAGRKAVVLLRAKGIQSALEMEKKIAKKMNICE
jgi:hypothetical protein